MTDNSSTQGPSESEIEALKKTTRISLEEALNVKPDAQKASPTLPGQMPVQPVEKKSTGPITGIPTHTSPIPQTIRLKRPATSPISIRPPDITTAPTAAKLVHPRSPQPQASTVATVIKKPISHKPLTETSRIILDIDSPALEPKQKTAPMADIVSTSEPTPGPKTIRLKRPSTIASPTHPEDTKDVAATVQTAKKSETAKIELPQAALDVPSTQRKTIKIKRTDRNIVAPRTIKVQRQAADKPAEKTIIKKEEEKAPVLEAVEDKSMPFFSILAGAAVICLALLVYLLTTQAFGPELILPVPPGLFSSN
ncbi:hypothetical protein ACFLQL_02065 [Verrucomicrobiota bacterium]